MRSPLVSIFLIIGVFLAGTTSAQVYQYDALNRLTQVDLDDGSGSNIVSTEFNYSVIGNKTRQSRR